MNLGRVLLHLGLYICAIRFYASYYLGQEFVKLGFDLMHGRTRIVSMSTSWHSGVHDATSINDITTIITTKNDTEVLEALQYKIFMKIHSEISSCYTEIVGFQFQN